MEPYGQDNTPLKMGSNRLALLTGSAKRTTPYQVSSFDRRQRLFSNMTTPLDMTDSMATPSDGNKSIHKACLDWRLVNKEAEVIRLKTEQTQLQSLMAGLKEEGEKTKMDHNKEMKDLQEKLTESRQSQREQERTIIELEAQVQSLRQQQHQKEESLVPEREHQEQTITQLKLSECKLVAQLQDLKQELRSIQYKHEQEIISLNHEIKCQGIEVTALQEEKKVFERNHASLRQEAQTARELRLEVNRLQTERDSLKNQLLDMKDGKSLSELLKQHRQTQDENDS